MKLAVQKQCGCGQTYDAIPANHKFAEDHEVYYWECENCKSTLTYIPNKDRTIQLLRGQTK